MAVKYDQYGRIDNYGDNGVFVDARGSGPVRSTKVARGGPDPYSYWHNIQAVLGIPEQKYAANSVMVPTSKSAAITQALIASNGMDAPDDGPSGGGNDPWGAFTGFRDDTPYDVRSMAQIGAEGLPHAAGTLVADKGQERLPPGSVLAFGDASTTSPAQQAIAAALLSGTTPAEQALEERAFGGGAPLGGDMQWSPAETAPAPSGDTWLGMREPGQTGALVARPGMVTGNRPIVGFHPQHRTSVAGGSAPGARFLNEQGVDTSHMTPGQLANALNKAIF